VHPVGGVDVVLDDDGNPVQRTAQPAGAPFGVELVGELRRVGIGFDQRMESGAALVVRVDACQVLVYQAACREPPTAHAVLKVRHGDLVEVPLLGVAPRARATG